jgi:hypothetical protein
VGAGAHAARIRTGIGLGQAEAADPFTGREPGQEFLALRLGAIGVDRVHHQRGLHRHHRAVAGVDALDLARDEAIADVVDARAAIAVDGRAEEAHLAHLAEDRGVGLLVVEGVLDPRHQLLLAILPGGIADHPFVLAELLLHQEGILPDEGGLGRLGRGGIAGGLSVHVLSLLYRPAI